MTTWWCGLLTDSSPKVRFRFFLHPLKNRKTRESTCWQKVRAKARYKSKSKKYSAGTSQSSTKYCISENIQYLHTVSSLVVTIRQALRQQDYSRLLIILYIKDKNEIKYGTVHESCCSFEPQRLRLCIETKCSRSHWCFPHY